MRTIIDKWKEFSNTLPPELPADILRTLQLAFFGGVASYLELEFEVDNDPKISGDASVAIIEGVHAEVQAFFENLSE